jgi:hypothetical protein
MRQNGSVEASRAGEASCCFGRRDTRGWLVTLQFRCKLHCFVDNALPD